MHKIETQNDLLMAEKLKFYEDLAKFESEALRSSEIINSPKSKIFYNFTSFGPTQIS